LDGIKHEAEHNHKNDHADDDDQIVQFEKLVADGSDRFLKIEAVFGERRRDREPQTQTQDQAGHIAWEPFNKSYRHAYLP